MGLPVQDLLCGPLLKDRARIVALQPEVDAQLQLQRPALACSSPPKRTVPEAKERLRKFDRVFVPSLLSTIYQTIIATDHYNRPFAILASSDCLVEVMSRGRIVASGKPSEEGVPAISVS